MNPKKKTEASTSRAAKQLEDQQTTENGEDETVSLNDQVKSHSKILESLKDLPKMMLAMQQKLEALESTPAYESEEEGLLSEGDDNIESLLNEIKGNSDETPADAESDTLMEILKVEDVVDYGPPISERVAESFRKCVTRPLSKETADKLKEVFKVPENLKLLGAPRINNEIWNVLPHAARTSDFKLQQSQLSLSHGLTAFAKIADTITSNKDKIHSTVAEELLRLAVNGANLIGSGFQEINQRRRQEIKPSLNEEYSAICSQKVPVTEWLFGDNLSESIKTSRAASQLVKKSAKLSRFQRHKPYNKSYRPQSGNFPRPSPGNRFKRGGPFSPNQRNQNPSPNFQRQPNRF